MKLGIVVQRYGPAINGGAELHARFIAERLSRHAEVHVATTCASDYVTWRNDLPEGTESLNGVTVHRFRVDHERDPVIFGQRSDRVFSRPHSLADELEWLRAEGPVSGPLTRYVARHATEFDYWIIFSYRYYHAYHAARAAGGRAILVPTAERDSAIGLALFRPIFQGVRAVMYNSPEERRMIEAVSGNQDVPSVVVGVGSEVPANPQPARFREKFNLRGPFAVYVGRVDENKGCRELFAYFTRYLASGAGRLSLVLIGNSILPIPESPRIRHLGFLEDADKFDAVAAAELLIMPSYFESLSMVALEAWALGRPVLANSRCEVLKGQCLRSNAGLYYDGELEFVEALRAIEHNRWLAGALGRNGRQFFRDHYDWSVIERKYLEMFARLSQEGSGRPIAPLPGWFERRRGQFAAGAEVVAALPSGPVMSCEPSVERPVAAVEPAGRPEPVSSGRPERAPRRYGRGPHRPRSASRSPRADGS